MKRTIIILGIFGSAVALTSTLMAAPDAQTGDGGSGDSMAPDFNKVPAPPPETPSDLWQKVVQFSASIAEAEGFFVSGSVPQRFHNPGDLGPGDTGFNGEEHDGSNVSILPDDVTGWNFLYKKVTRMLSGNSSTFPITMTFTQVAQTYAKNWQPWLATQIKNLGVNGKTTLAEYARS